MSNKLKCPKNASGHSFTPKTGSNWFVCDHCKAQGSFDILTREWTIRPWIIPAE